ncbi:MAG: hypothetical protein WCK26_02855 [Candidatus Saccharibacteria bacterium]
METQSGVELVTKSDLLGLELASWNQPRNTEQLLGFIARREAEIASIEE